MLMLFKILSQVNCEFLLNDMLMESVGPPEPQVKTKPVNNGLFHLNTQFFWAVGMH